jgi:hypothetical protein
MLKEPHSAFSDLITQLIVWEYGRSLVRDDASVEALYVLLRSSRELERLQVRYSNCLTQYGLDLTAHAGSPALRINHPERFVTSMVYCRARSTERAYDYALRWIAQSVRMAIDESEELNATADALREVVALMTLLRIPPYRDDLELFVCAIQCVERSQQKR